MFNFIAVLVFLPLELVFHFLEKSATFLTTLLWGNNLNVRFVGPLDYIVNPVAKFAQTNVFGNNGVWMLIISLLFLFISLRYFVKVMKPIAQSEFKHLLHKHVFSSPLRSFFLGLIFTIAVQSSSVSTALIVPLAGIGIVTLHKVFTYVLGANIGTTVTSMMAALVTGSPAAVTVALEHLLFNTLGSIMIYPIRKIPILLSQNLAKLALKSKFYPLAYITTIFYVVPAFAIYLFH